MAQKSVGIRKRKNGLLEKRIRVANKRISVYGTSLKEIKEKEGALVEKTVKQVARESGRVLLDDYFKEYLICCEKRGIKERTIRNYACIYNKHVSPVLGGREVREIRRGEIAVLQKKWSGEMKPGSVGCIFTVLRLLFREAVLDEIIDRSPVEGIRIKGRKSNLSNGIHRALTEEEIKLFMGEAENSPFYEMYGVMLCTGIRCGEAAALEWSDIDEKSGMIKITKTVTYRRDGTTTIGSPKSLNSCREVPITSAVKRFLNIKKRRMKNIVPLGNMRVFSSVQGGIIRADLLNTDIERILAQIEDKGTKIPVFTSHAFRKTYATIFVDQGGNPNVLKALLGHASLETTMDIYVSANEDTKRKEMQQLRIKGLG